MESYCSPSWRALLSSFTHSSWAYGLAEGEAAHATLSACGTARFHPTHACPQPFPPPKRLFPRLPAGVWGPVAPQPLAGLPHPAPRTPPALPSTPRALPSTGTGAQPGSRVPVRRAIRSALLTTLKRYTAAHASGACPGCWDPSREPFALRAKYSFSGAGSSAWAGGKIGTRGTLPALGSVAHTWHSHCLL